MPITGLHPFRQKESTFKGTVRCHLSITGENIKIHMLSNSYELEIFALLGCYAVKIGSYLPTFQDNLSFPSLQAMQPFFLEHFTIEEGTDRFSQNVSK
jgi:hypothetical protein